ncbi:helix-turn-helix domain-containing protein [Kitasatospora sp. NPDC002040]|uniref:helix-turn-helix domain-containing protein n=1 Tax=Kitasatospora sp. NPDC002040 TaxID=3154661 RepID=UPI00331B4ACB
MNTNGVVVASVLLAELVGFDSDEPLQVKQIAAALGTTKWTVHREVNSGRLPHYRIGSGIRIERSAFRAYLKDHNIPVRLGPVAGCQAAQPGWAPDTDGS